MKKETPVKLIQFIAGNQSFCLGADDVVRIQRQATLTLNTGGTPYGWILEKGKRIPAYHCAQSLRINTRLPERRSQVLIMERRGHTFAILVDRVQRILDASQVEIRPLPMALANSLDDYFEGLVQHDNGYDLLFSPTKLVSQFSRRKILLPPKPAPPDRVGGKRDISGGWQPMILLFSLSPKTIDGRRTVFGLSISQIGEVIKPRSLMALPGAHPCLMGLVEWRNQPVPFIDLNRRIWNEPMPTSNQARFLIARTRAQGEYLSFAVQPNMRFLHRADEFKPRGQRAPIAAPFVREVFESEREVLIVPFLEGIVSSS